MQEYCEDPVSGYNRCTVCSQLGSSLCRNCHKVSYCSLEHSELDLNDHKKECYPAKIQKDEVKGRFIVATRAIDKGELIFQEKPLMTGPNPSIVDEHMPLCLGCYKQVKSGYKCSVCKWPMCDSQCEKLLQHSGFECQILASRRVPAAEKPVNYFFVNVLRCFLLHEISPSKWEKILNLEYHEQFRLKRFSRRRLLEVVFHYFETFLKPPSSAENLISQILGAIEINAHGFSDDEKVVGFNRAGHLLFHKLSLLSHDCVPNAMWLRVNETKPLGTFSAKLVASIPIAKGDVISISYTDVMENTIERKSYLNEGYFFTCMCSRCSDPTELGTYFSAVKCPKKNCVSGYLLPVPSEIMSYKCNKCSLLNDWPYLTQLQDICTTEYEALQFEPTKENLNKIDDFIEANEGRTLHPNHQMILNAKQEMIIMMGKMPNRSEEFIKKQISLCQSVLKVMDQICPGLTYERGTVLHCLFDAKFKLLKLASLSLSRGNFNSSTMNAFKSNKKGAKIIEDEDTFLRDLVKIGKEAREIRALIPEHGEKVAKIQAKLKLLAETYSILAEDCTLDYYDHFSEESNANIPILGVEDDEDVVEFIHPLPRVFPNCHPTLLEKLRTINKAEFVIIGVIICAVGIVIQLIANCR